LTNFTKEAFGEFSFELSEAYYLNAKTNMSGAIKDTEKALEYVKKGIEIETNKPLTQSKSDLHLAMMWLLKATIRKEQSKLREAIKCYANAIRIISQVENT
jgi:tetratricopeptide (TPR) repeat protein